MSRFEEERGALKHLTRGNKYQERYLEVLSKKFSNPRDLLGNPSTEEIRVIHDIDTNMSSVPGFVAVTLHGSTAVGLRKKDSDVDMGVLYDSSVAGFDKKVLEFTLSTAALPHKGFLKWLRRTSRTIDTNPLFQCDLNVLREENYSEEKLSNALVFLTEVSTSTQKVKEYRKLAGDRLRAMSAEERSTLIVLALRRVGLFEQRNFIHTGTRMPKALKGEELLEAVAISGTMKDFVEARGKLWLERMIKFYELDAEEFKSISI